MSQNRSHAVMSQRHEAHDSLDDFPTPPWAARALCEHVITVDPDDVAWEPAANRGYLVRGLTDYFDAIRCSDIHDYGAGYEVADFLFPGVDRKVHWIITNPPFRLAEEFACRALELATDGVALLVRTQFLESVGRYQRLFLTRPPLIVAQFVERVPMVKGRCDGSASTATSYCWVVWAHGPRNPTEFVWIPPCRARLEREGDYDLTIAEQRENSAGCYDLAIKEIRKRGVAEGRFAPDPSDSEVTG